MKRNKRTRLDRYHNPGISDIPYSWKNLSIALDNLPKKGEVMFDFDWFEKQENYPEKSQFKVGQEVEIDGNDFFVEKVYYLSNNIEALHLVGLSLWIYGIDFLFCVNTLNEIKRGIKIIEV
jgi:hypothetical protein